MLMGSAPYKARRVTLWSRKVWVAQDSGRDTFAGARRGEPYLHSFWTRSSACASPLSE